MAKRKQKKNRGGPKADDSTSDTQSRLIPEEELPERREDGEHAESTVGGGSSREGGRDASAAGDTGDDTDGSRSNDRGDKIRPLRPEDFMSDKNAATLEDIAEEVTISSEAWKEMQGKVNEYLELAQRTRADLENYRKRAARDLEQTRTRVQADLLREILNPLDDLDRALSHAEEAREFETLSKGVGMVRDGIWKALGTTGFERIEASPGTQFNPHLHEAMMQIPHPDFGPNEIVEEMQPGYKIGEQVLRAPKVVVSAGPPLAAPESEEK